MIGNIVPVERRQPMAFSDKIVTIDRDVMVCAMRPDYEPSKAHRYLADVLDHIVPNVAPERCWVNSKGRPNRPVTFRNIAPGTVIGGWITYVDRHDAAKSNLLEYFMADSSNEGILVVRCNELLLQWQFMRGKMMP